VAAATVALLGGMVVAQPLSGPGGPDFDAADRAQAATSPASGAAGLSRHRALAPRGAGARITLRAPTAIVVDLPTGRVIYAKRPNQRRPIASITKIMTAVLVLERAELSEVVTVSRRAANTPPIRIGLRRGERITVRNLMWGLLLWSGNDAAVALAEHVSGRVRAFVRLMNQRGRELGLANTRFTSPNGLSDWGYSTVRDLAALTRAAMRDRTFARIVRTVHHRIGGPPGQLHKLRNLNDLLVQYRGAIGVKTGYTLAAGNCVVGAARRGSRALVAVVLGDPPGTHWKFAYRDVRRLLDYGFRTSPEL
jgi:serine-type D-Ala-D-Ala carboxypeptidase (penicillin-binding protein 5/6)